MQRSLSLDILKLILSFFVVMGHLQPLFYENALGGWFLTNGLCRVVVPCFFIISGFFIFSKIDDMKAVGKYLGQLLIVYITWSIFYLQFYYEGTGIATITGRFLFGYFHLWYLPALFSGIILFILARRFLKNDFYIIVIIILIYLFGHVMDPSRSMAHFYRNGLFIGFPFIAIGYYIRKYSLKNSFTTAQIISIIALSICTLLVETYIYYLDELKVTDMYLSTLIISPTLVILCLKYPFKVRSSLFTEYFSDIPSGIYYIHVFFVFKMYSHDYNIYSLPIIFLASILTTIPIIFINRRLPIRIFL